MIIIRDQQKTRVLATKAKYFAAAVAVRGHVRGGGGTTGRASVKPLELQHYFAP